MSLFRKVATKSPSSASVESLALQLRALQEVKMQWVRGLWIPSKDQELAEAESRLLALSGADVKVKDVPIGNNLHIHTVEAGKLHKGNGSPLVLCHGFGMGVGGWYMNYKQLSRHKHLYAIDWLGMGQSSRPKFPCADVAETEAWFTESLERWREANKIDKMVLCGHSLGGYLATAYALKHPDKVEHLILASPAGVPRKPEVEPWRARLEDMPPFRRFFVQSMVSSVTALWDAGYSPQDIIRFIGPLGPRMIYGYARSRFGNPEVDKEAMGAYLYHNAAAIGSGEYSLGKVLLPFAYAREPLCTRLPSLKVPVTFIYGETDWMDARNADAVVPEMKVPAKVVRVPNAGHQLFLDNPSFFNESVLQACGIKPVRKVSEKGSTLGLSWLNQDDVTVSVKASG